MEKKLNHLLANLVVEYHKLQNYHWYVKGADFFTAHTKLEEYYDEINEAIDEVAEHILMLQGKPLASLQEFLQTASIKEADDTFKSSANVYDEVEKDFHLLLDEVSTVKKAADESENYVISALMDGYIANFTKALWMLSQRKA